MDIATTEIYTYYHTLSLHDALPICLFDHLAVDSLLVGGHWNNETVDIAHEISPSALLSGGRRGRPGLGFREFGRLPGDGRPAFMKTHCLVRLQRLLAPMAYAGGVAGSRCFR